MARPERNNVDFPKWNPTRLTKSRIFDNKSTEMAFKYFRASSSAFGKNKNVRMFLLEKYKNKCPICFNSENLEVDHISSVYSCFRSKLFEFCNSEKNLQILCNRCNSWKSFRNG